MEYVVTKEGFLWLVKQKVRGTMVCFEYCRDPYQKIQELEKSWFDLPSEHQEEVLRRKGYNAFN